MAVTPNGMTLGTVMVDDGMHVAAAPRRHAAVNEALRVALPARRVDWCTVERELHQVLDLDALRRAGARHHEAAGIPGWRMLTWPNESTTPSRARMRFAVTSSSSAVVSGQHEERK